MFKCEENRSNSSIQLIKNMNRQVNRIVIFILHLLDTVIKL